MTHLDPARLVGRLTVLGWLLIGAPLGMIAFQLERVRDVGPQQFATVWEQRIEVLSFLVLPPNLVVLAPAVLAAVVATWLAGAEREPWCAGLLGLSAGIAAAMAVIGVVSVITTFASANFARADLGGVYMRIGGTSMALGLLFACWTAHRAATD